MGLFQEYSTTAAARKPDLFTQAEKQHFQHVVEALRDMPYCSEADLCQAAKSYFYQSARATGTAHLFREAYVEEKAQRIAKWWNQKHTASRTPRPHTKYTPAQAARGRQVALIRKKGATDWLALQAQLMRDRGDKLTAIAGELGCTVRTVSNLSKRLFPKIVGVVLGLSFGWKHGKSSIARTQKQDVLKSEKLRCFHVEEVPAVQRPAGEGIDGEIDDLEAIGLAIPDLLLSHWAAQSP